jgi:pyrimidine-nucleoside phosphorylase
MRALDIILNKRRGLVLSREEIHFLIKGYVNGEIPEYQISAWLMAVFFQGMTPRETGDLTGEMIESGETFDLGGIEGPFVDKHSTGGVGDKVSLILAPLAAACGLRIPMMSGRSLGHTGGTLDKLESITGYHTDLEPDRFKQILETVGYAMTGQSSSIVPADRLLYALRDVTGTVESIPLITASILSKKFAEGADALVFDVKCGGGAFMKTLDDARRLAESLVSTGGELGKQIVAVITRMDEPLGRMVGNFLEVEESAVCLQGKGPADLMEVTIKLTSWMLIAGGICTSLEEARLLCQRKIDSGDAWKKFLENIKAQGGDTDLFIRDIGSRRAKLFQNLAAERSGYVTSIDAFQTGMAGVYLGAGRNKADDAVLFDVGVELKVKTGEYVNKGDALCTVFGEERERLTQGLNCMHNAYTVSDEKPDQQSYILEEISTL